MGTMTLLLTALGLSMDAFAVSVSNGMCYQHYTKRHIVLTAAAFGFFQALMPTIGFFGGVTFAQYISPVDHWIALCLLAFIGGNMIYGSIKEMRALPEDAPCPKKFTMKSLALQALATSIDALVVGVGFAVMQVEIGIAASFIGLITFSCCLVGAFLGKRFGRLLGNRAEILGGIILIGIGLNIFIEHVFFS